jgi:hypothetical protein
MRGATLGEKLGAAMFGPSGHLVVERADDRGRSAYPSLYLRRGESIPRDFTIINTGVPKGAFSWAHTSERDIVIWASKYLRA